MIGYKIFDSDWKCRDKQYGVGEVTEQEGELMVFKNGLHYCETALGCLRYFDLSKERKYGQIEVLGDVVGTFFSKATNKLKVIAELSYEEFRDLCSGTLDILGNDGIYSEYNYIKGRKEGLYRAWHTNGGLYRSCNYVEDKLEGLYEVWHSNGLLSKRCNYVGGEQLGIYESWDLNGKLIERLNYAYQEKIHGKIFQLRSGNAIQSYDGVNIM